MALVMLPCDLPWWDNVRKHLKKISDTKNTLELMEGMQKIYELCNISLDPDEDTNDPHQFVNFLNFLDNDLTSEERSNFLNTTLPIMAQRALRLKDYKPKNGLHFSLQQQPDCTELDYNFVSSLLANAFFSTFPKRTDKSHPTLQDFNFANFLKNLGSNSEKSKLKSLFYYFDWLESDSANSKGSLKIFRQVMSSKEWLTIEDWLECSLPLCPLRIKHEGKLERSETDSLQICFASAKIGGPVLSSGSNTQECVNFMTIPELLTVLLNVEALEDNEVVTIERARHISRISDPKNKANLEKLDKARELTICCLDADDYTKLPIGQYEEDNILRELNKCLLAFQQKQSKRELTPPPSAISMSSTISYNHRSRRLSPIGESLSSNQSDPNVIPLITQQSCSTTRSFTPPDEAGSSDNGNKLSVVNNKVRAKLATQQNLKKSPTCEAFVHNRRGRFIVLGSSGECLPVSRKPFLERDRSFYDSCESSDEEFHSARTSLDDSDEENYHKRYSIDLETPERRLTFAQRLRQALRHEEMENEKSTSSQSSNESYACGISVTGSGVADRDIKVRRAGSTGFALREESLDEDFLENSLHQERQWIDKFKSKQSALSRKESKSSDYSFSTDFSSEMEEVYEQFSRWLDNPILDTDDGTKKKLDGRELAIVKFAGSILKRTLSESFAGIPVPLTESCVESPQPNNENFKKNRLVLNAKSLSLELAKQKHRLAAQLSTEKVASNNNNISSSTILTPLENNNELTTRKKDRKTWFITCVNEAIVQTLEDVAFSVTLPQNKKLSQITKRPKDGLKSVTTGNWGCGSSRKGDVQLKVIIQWLAASVAGVPSLVYYTCGHPQLVKLDTVTRILIDRKWTVKDLTEAALRYSNQVLHGKELSGTLFEELIGVERTI